MTYGTSNGPCSKTLLLTREVLNVKVLPKYFANIYLFEWLIFCNIEMEILFLLQNEAVLRVCAEPPPPNASTTHPEVVKKNIIDKAKENE